MVYLYSSGGREASLREREREKRQGGGIGEMKLIRNQLGCSAEQCIAVAGVTWHAMAWRGIALHHCIICIRFHLETGIKINRSPKKVVYHVRIVGG